MAPKLCNSIWHDNQTLKFWDFRSKKCLRKAAQCDFGGKVQYFRYSHNIWTFFFMLKYPSSTNTVHFSYYSKQKTRKLLATKFKDYFSHSVSNTTFQQTNHYTGKKLQDQITWNFYFPNRFLGTFHIVAYAASNKSTYEYVPKTSLRIRKQYLKTFL